MRKKAVIEALTRSDGNRTQGAKILGVSRRTLCTWVETMGLRSQFPAKLGPPFKKPCLKCGKFIRKRYPGLCVNCKRHVDFKDGEDDDYKVHL